MRTVIFTLDEVLPKDVWHYLIKRIAGWKCERCGSGENLHAHHIDRVHENMSLSNGEALCKQCHDEEHFQDRSQRITKYNQSSQGRKRSSEIAKKMQKEGIFVVGSEKCEPGCKCRRHTWREE